MHYFIYLNLISSLDIYLILGILTSGIVPFGYNSLLYLMLQKPTNMLVPTNVAVGNAPFSESELDTLVHFLAQLFIS